MNNSIVTRLVAKDLFLYRWFIVGSTLAGLASLLVSGLHGLTGLIMFMTTIVALGVFIAMYGILVERKEKTLLFVLSLPVTPLQYAAAKVLAALIAFLIPVIVLAAVALGYNLAFDPPPNGEIPVTVAMLGLFLANFCFLVALLLITGMEVWAVAGILLTNLSIPIFMNVVYGLPGVAEHVQGPVAVWSPAILTILGVEALVALLALGIAFTVQSRRTDFI
jgi:ABC-type transport system involved in multi-copper enzyme maturation permease subunit